MNINDMFEKFFPFFFLQATASLDYDKKDDMLCSLEDKDMRKILLRRNKKECNQTTLSCRSSKVAGEKILFTFNVGGGKF